MHLRGNVDSLSYLEEKVDHWLGDFSLSDEFKECAFASDQQCLPLLRMCLLACCESRSVSVEDIEEEDIVPALKKVISTSGLSSSSVSGLKNTLAVFFTLMEKQGRFANGEQLGDFIKACQPVSAQKSETRPGKKLNRNEPCPCGSGLKYKKCCLGLLK